MKLCALLAIILTYVQDWTLQQILRIFRISSKFYDFS